MRALCPVCGYHHEVVRVLEDGVGEMRKDVYQVAPLDACDRVWIAQSELMEAQARYGQDPIERDETDEL